jgi:hypothetical protein
MGGAALHGRDISSPQTKTAAVLITRIMALVDDFVGEASQADDMTMIVVRAS